VSRQRNAEAYSEAMLAMPSRARIRKIATAAASIEYSCNVVTAATWSNAS
jgi:hypothetical protein